MKKEREIEELVEDLLEMINSDTDSPLSFDIAGAITPLSRRTGRIPGYE